ncbi:thiol:disulfide interchange protein DsbA/DsbL [Gammaproteobacteria bacterium]|nr:thiol:disulfide interchange protein DsbA/DsbL [Gammaproteobacteria bacterium]
MINFRTARRQFLALPLVVLIASACSAEVTEGDQYILLDPPVEVSRDDGKIEIREFFWYGCGHCYKLHQEIVDWKGSLADDIAFVPTPASGDNWDAMARVYYAMQALAITEQADEALWELIHTEKKQLNDDDDIADFFSQFGADKQDALDALKSFGVDSEMRKGRKLTGDYQVVATPTVIVDGRYVVNNRGVTSYQEILEVADALVEKVRSER